MSPKRIFLILAIIVAVAVGYVLTSGFATTPPEEMAGTQPDEIKRDGGAASEGSEPPIADMTPPVEALPPRSPDEDAPLPDAIIEVQPEFGEDETHREVEVYVATNRTINLRPDEDDPASKLTDTIGPLHYATALVSIPRDHQMGHLESQNWISSWLFEPDEEKHVILQDVRLWDRDALMDVLGTHLDDTNNSVLMYVHGFNTSFDKAARRAGQLTYDLTWDGPSVLFSWPSQGRAIDYFTDSTNAEDSVPAMKQVLRDVAAHDPDRIIIIAHSMGTRIISNAIKELVLAGDEVVSELTMVILAAPDINARTFREQIAPRFRDAVLPVTLYASAEDSALKASKRANGFRRIGDTTDGVPLVPGIDVVDATGAISDFFGHTYFGDNSSILSDIYEMVHKEADPIARPTLLPVPDAPPSPEAITHWRINIGGSR